MKGAARGKDGAPSEHDDAHTQVARLERELAAARGAEVEATALRKLAAEANERLILATLRAQELAEEAGKAQAIAEATAVKLRESEAQMRVVSEFRARMMGEVGHDLHGPLISINVATNVLLADQPLPPQKAVLDGILASSERMLEMVRQLLDFTRTRLGGGIPIERAPGDLTAILCAVVVETETAHPDRRIQLDAPSPVPGSWDVGRLGRVISNLLDNALRHGREDCPVKVRLDLDGDHASIEVENEGPPIGPELLPMLFQPFHRGARSGRGATGLGLGLFISRETVTAHGGTIEVASSPQGTTLFRVRLPRSEREPDPQGAAVESLEEPLVEGPAITASPTPAVSRRARHATARAKGARSGAGLTKVSGRGRRRSEPPDRRGRRGA